MTLEVNVVPCLSDNYAYLIRETATGQTAVVDVPDAAPVLSALDEKGLGSIGFFSPTTIRITSKGSKPCVPEPVRRSSELRATRIGYRRSMSRCPKVIRFDSAKPLRK